MNVIVASVVYEMLSWSSHRTVARDSFSSRSCKTSQRRTVVRNTTNDPIFLMCHSCVFPHRYRYFIHSIHHRIVEWGFPSMMDVARGCSWIMYPKCSSKQDIFWCCIKLSFMCTRFASDCMLSNETEKKSKNEISSTHFSLPRFTRARKHHTMLLFGPTLELKAKVDNNGKHWASAIVVIFSLFFINLWREMLPYMMSTEKCVGRRGKWINSALSRHNKKVEDDTRWSRRDVKFVSLSLHTMFTHLNRLGYLKRERLRKKKLKWEKCRDSLPLFFWSFDRSEVSSHNNKRPIHRQ